MRLKNRIFHRRQLPCTRCWPKKNYPSALSSVADNFVVGNPLLSLQMTVNVQQWNLNSTSVFNDNNHRRGQIASAGWTTLRTKNCKTGNKLIKNNNHFAFIIVVWIYSVTLLREKFLQFDWLRAVVFQLNLKYLHVKITNLLLVVV